MSKAIALGTLSGNGTLTQSIQGFHAGRFSLLVTGDFGTPAGTLTIEGGLLGSTEVIKITDLAGAHVSPAVIGVAGVYNFYVNCDSLEFILAGATGPSLVLTLFPENRS